MKEVNLDPIIKKSRKLLVKVEKDMNVAEHQTGAMGQVPKQKKKKRKNYMPNSISDEQRLNKSFLQLRAIFKIDAAPNAGFGTTDAQNGEKEEDKKSLPEKVSSESGFKRKSVNVSKASYEYIAGETSYTDESNPSEDVFYLPENVDMESNDTSEEAEEKEEKKKELEEEGIDVDDENVSDAGAARKKQNYNVGTMENAQIGNQGV